MGRRKRAKRTGRHRPDRGGVPRATRIRRRAVAALTAVALIAALIAGGLLISGPLSGSGPAGPRAAVVDQLGLTFPNPAFVREATDMLEQAGYTVDYYPGEEVTVDFYRTLPGRGYDFILLRAHSARVRLEDTLTDEATLFTSEIYDETKYPEEMDSRHLGIGRPLGESSDLGYVSVWAGFIEHDMKGKFKDSTVVVLMGCDGLRSRELAEAFMERGAKTVIGWDALVSADHSDEATERLLHHLLIAELTGEQAVARAMAEVGPDPTYGAELHVLADGG